MSINDMNSLIHTKRNCKYHIVYAPNYKKKIFCYEKWETIEKIIKDVVRMEKSKEHISRSMSRPCTYVGGNTAKTECLKLHGVPEREEQHNVV